MVEGTCVNNSMFTNHGLHFIVCKSRGFDVFSTKNGELRLSNQI